MDKLRAQCLLRYLGYYLAEVDGIWGPKSVNALTNFQDDFGGFTVSGVLNEDTHRALRHAVAYGMPARNTSEDFWDSIQYFTRDEFRCQCYKYHATPYCNGFPAEPQELLVKLCDRARKHFGAPGHVVSGLRCRQHNADSGGVVNSQHMYGEAADLRIDGVSSDKLLAYMQQQPEVRYAYKINDTNVHFDIPKGSR